MSKVNQLSHQPFWVSIRFLMMDSDNIEMMEDGEIEEVNEVRTHLKHIFSYNDSLFSRIKYSFE